MSVESDPNSASESEPNSSPPKSPIPRKPTYDSSASSSSEEEERQIQSEAEEEVEQIANLFRKKSKKRQRDFNTNDDDENLVDNILKDMMLAADEDIEANRNDMPALNKLKMLEKVCKFLIVSKYHDLFLEMNGTFILGKWLAQLPDGSFPSTPLKMGLLQAIQDVPITTKNLQESDLGKSVMAIFQNTNESVGVKRLAKQLIDKWSRMIYEIETDYSALDRAEENEESEAPVHSSKSLNKILHQENNSAFTRIPDKGLFDFKIRPAPKHSDAPTQHQHNNDSTISRLKKKMQMRKKGKSKPTGGSMSVDGRNLY